MSKSEVAIDYTDVRERIRSHSGSVASRKMRERIIEGGMFLCAVFSVAVTVGIVWVLVYESWNFFRNVSIIDFLTDTQWTVLFENPRYGIMPLVTGTLVTSMHRSGRCAAAGDYHCDLFERIRQLHGSGNFKANP